MDRRMLLRLGGVAFLGTPVIARPVVSVDPPGFAPGWDLSDFHFEIEGDPEDPPSWVMRGSDPGGQWRWPLGGQAGHLGYHRARRYMEELQLAVARGVVTVKHECIPREQVVVMLGEGLRMLAQNYRKAQGII